MDIKSGSGYPSSSLSNFAAHSCLLDGVNIASAEGFLQSLKFANPDMQVEVCKLTGYTAKKKGKFKNWQESQTLYWRGVPIKRDSQDYQDLLDRFYIELCAQCEGFRNALIATQDATIEHSIGRTKTNETILTRQEFCSRLTKLRNKVRLLSNVSPDSIRQAFAKGLK